jgi:hypothetical protein
VSERLKCDICGGDDRAARPLTAAERARTDVAAWIRSVCSECAKRFKRSAAKTPEKENAA